MKFDSKVDAIEDVFHMAFDVEWNYYCPISDCFVIRVEDFAGRSFWYQAAIDAGSVVLVPETNCEDCMEGMEEPKELEVRTWLDDANMFHRRVYIVAYSGENKECVS